jgi:hypothetical protein
MRPKYAQRPETQVMQADWPVGARESLPSGSKLLGRSNGSNVSAIDHRVLIVAATIKATSGGRQTKGGQASRPHVQSAARMDGSWCSSHHPADGKFISRRRCCRSRHHYGCRRWTPPSNPKGALSSTVPRSDCSIPLATSGHQRSSVTRPAPVRGSAVPVTRPSPFARRRSGGMLRSHLPGWSRSA